MANRLYAEFAKYYAAITNDRDFKGQLNYILNNFHQGSPCTTFLELFAGQSYHGLAASRIAEIDVWAIDSSSDMKQLAIEKGFPSEDKYIVGDLPQALSLIPRDNKFNCIICLYHGLSNLKKVDAFTLLKNVKEILSPNGKFYLEIHDIYYIMEYIANQIIQYTSIDTGAQNCIKYAWPSDKIKWDSFSFKAEVPVRIILEESNNFKEFTSTDYIYSFEDICFMSELLGFKCRILNNDEVRKLFGISLLIEMSL